jgi:hypothetical protein
VGFFASPTAFRRSYHSFWRTELLVATSFPAPMVLDVCVASLRTACTNESVGIGNFWLAC